MNKEVQDMTQEIQDRISELAYLMWESAGRQQGMAMNYWLAAEKDILNTMQTAAETVIPAEQKAPKAGKAAPAKAKPAAAKPAGKTAAKPAAPGTATRKKTKP
jgi:peptidoglycan hydrolase CwlO-like protein